MYELFDDQKHDVASIRRLLSQQRKTIYAASTGSGKTVTAGHIMQSASRKGSKVLVLVHRRELVGQFVHTLHEAGLDDRVGVVCGGWTPTPWAPIQVAMVFSWARRKMSFRPDLIIIDECHHAKAKTWETVIERYPDAYLLGLTATPVRLDGKGLSPPFTSMHCGLSTPELIEARRLSPIHVLRIPSSFRKKGLRMTGGEYNRKDMEKKADAKFVADAVNAYLKYTPDRQCIMFGVSKRHARDVAERFAEFGVSAAAVGDDTPDPVREDTFRQFARGGIRVVCNVSLIDEGFDVPACDVVIDAAPTASVVRYLQRAGRAMRYREGKMAILLDLVGNSYDHGLPDQSREWELVVDNPKDLREENRRKGNNLRCCRQCLCLFSPKLVECPHCGTEHDGTPVHEIDIDLIEAKPKEPKRPKAKMTMRERGQKTGEAKSLARLGKYDEAWEAIKSVQMEAEYHNGWAHITADLIGIPHENRHSGD